MLDVDRHHSNVSPGYTRAVFHLPREKSHSVKSPTEVSEMNTPQKTPECCHHDGASVVVSAEDDTAIARECMTLTVGIYTSMRVTKLLQPSQPASA